MCNLTQPVAQAIAEIRSAFPCSKVDVESDGEGGAYVVVHDVPLSDVYAQQTTWIAFHITYAYPHADVYPHFVRRDLSRTDNKPLGDAMSEADFRGLSAIQLSRRSSRLNPATDTAYLKLRKVLQWLDTRS